MNDEATTQHVLITPQTCMHREDDDHSCQVCDGGLAVCVKCGKFETGLDEPCVSASEATTQEFQVPRCPIHGKVELNHRCTGNEFGGVPAPVTIPAAATDTELRDAIVEKALAKVRHRQSADAAGKCAGCRHDLKFSNFGRTRCLWGLTFDGLKILTPECGHKCEVPAPEPDEEGLPFVAPTDEFYPAPSAPATKPESVPAPPVGDGVAGDAHSATCCAKGSIVKKHGVCGSECIYCDACSPPRDPFNVIADYLQHEGFQNVTADGPRVTFYFYDQQYVVQRADIVASRADVDAFHRGVDAAKEAIRSEIDAGKEARLSAAWNLSDAEFDAAVNTEPSIEDAHFYAAMFINAIARKCGNDPGVAVDAAQGDARRAAFDEAIEIAKDTVVTGGWGSASGMVMQRAIVNRLEFARAPQRKEVR